MRKYVFALSALLTSVLLSVPAYASEFAGDGEGTIGTPGAGRYSIERVLGAMGDLVEVMERLFAIMVSNPLFVVLLAGSLLTLGVRIFRKVKSAAKG